MPLTVYFETHSTSEDNVARLASGWFDVDLAPEGVEQARRVGERYRDVPLDAVYAADLRRASRTAGIAFEDRDVPVHLDRRLREVDYGEWTRLPSAEVEAARHRFARQPFPGGQSYAEVVEGVRSLLEEVAAAHPGGGTVLLIGCFAPWAALEHLCAGHALEDVLAAEREWQPGWRYEYRARAGAREAK